eukprot:Sdes_comp10462_c0_seq1m2165
MADNHQMESMPIICPCGFYGHPQFMNLCSKCYKDKQKEDMAKQTEMASHVDNSNNSQTIPSTPSTSQPTFPPLELETNKTHPLPTEVKPTSAINAVPSPPSNSLPLQKNKSKCWSCEAKVSLVKQSTNKCKCDYIFCDKHRSAGSGHECTYDFKTLGRAELHKNSPKLLDKRGLNEM